MSFAGCDDYIISKQEFKSIANLKEIDYLWLHLEINSEADFFNFPEEPLDLEKNKLLDHCYFFRFQIFSPSHMRMIAAQIPNCRAFAFLCEAFDIESAEYIPKWFLSLDLIKRLHFSNPNPLLYFLSLHSGNPK